MLNAPLCLVVIVSLVKQLCAYICMYSKTCVLRTPWDQPSVLSKCVLIFMQVALHAKGYFGTITKYPADYVGILTF